MKNKKAMTQQEIVTWIIVILVGIIILLWLFGANIQNWIYNLPEYSVPKEDVEIDISGQSDVGVEGQKKCNTIGNIGDQGEVSLNDEVTNLFYDSKEKQLYFKQNQFGSKIYISSYIGYDEIKIRTGFLEDPEFLLGYSILPSLDKLREIDYSFIQGGRLCKTDERIEADKKEKTDRINKMIKDGKSNSYVFIFDNPKFLGLFGSNFDSIDIYWSFIDNSPAIRISVDKNSKTTSILKSVKDLNDLSESIKDGLAEDDFSYIYYILFSKSPAEFENSVENVFEQKDKNFYLEYKGEKYYSLSKTKLNNLFYVVDDVDVFKTAEVKLSEFKIE